MMENNRKSYESPLPRFPNIMGSPESQLWSRYADEKGFSIELRESQAIKHGSCGHSQPWVWGGNAGVAGAWEEKATISYIDSIIKSNITLCERPKIL